MKEFPVPSGVRQEEDLEWDEGISITVDESGEYEQRSALVDLYAAKLTIALATVHYKRGGRETFWVNMSATEPHGMPIRLSFNLSPQEAEGLRTALAQMLDWRPLP